MGGVLGRGRFDEAVDCGWIQGFLARSVFVWISLSASVGNSAVELGLEGII